MNAQSLAELLCAQATTRRFLVVDDNEDDIIMVRRELRNVNAVIDSAHTCDLGLKMVLSKPYDIIFLDAHLPDGLDGIELGQQIRNYGIKSCIVILTGSSNNDVLMSKAVQAHFIIVPKPLKLSQIGLFAFGLGLNDRLSMCQGHSSLASSAVSSSSIG